MRTYGFGPRHVSQRIGNSDASVAAFLGSTIGRPAALLLAAIEQHEQYSGGWYVRNTGVKQKGQSTRTQVLGWRVTISFGTFGELRTYSTARPHAMRSSKQRVQRSLSAVRNTKRSTNADCNSLMQTEQITNHNVMVVIVTSRLRIKPCRWQIFYLSQSEYTCTEHCTVQYSFSKEIN